MNQQPTQQQQQQPRTQMTSEAKSESKTRELKQPDQPQLQQLKPLQEDNKQPSDNKQQQPVTDQASAAVDVDDEGKEQDFQPTAEEEAEVEEMMKNAVDLFEKVKQKQSEIQTQEDAKRVARLLALLHRLTGLFLALYLSVCMYALCHPHLTPIMCCFAPAV